MSYNRLLQPKANPFSIFIYYPKEGNVILKTFSSQIISSYELNKYKEQGAYCNSFNDLFISEGKNFWIINNSSFAIRKKSGPIDKKNHSIIFLSSLSDSSKIFLVGGSDKKTFYYDLKKNYFLNWAETNEQHIKPALIKIDDYLYIFDGFKQSKICFERTKLSENIKKWEKIVPNFDKKIISYFPSKYFATTFYSNGKIMFLGGDNIKLENNNTCLFDIKNNKISLSSKGTNDNMIFYDQTFYKLNNKSIVALPYELSETHEIAVFDKDEQSLIKKSINFICDDKNNDNDNVNDNDNDYNIDNEKNKKVEKKYEEKIDMNRNNYFKQQIE